MDDQPLAQVDSKRRDDEDDDRGKRKRRHNPKEHIAYLHTDHLGTPRLATDANQAIVWRWESDAFGAKKPEDLEDDDEDEHKDISVTLRFPGQYADKETGLFYNWNRYYDPRVGRYITSDPIGFAGGLNTYIYVRNNPLRWTDTTGLVIETWEPEGLYGPTSENTMCKEAQCPWPVTITWSYGLSSAPIRPSETKVYSGKCLLTFGIGFKGTSMAATTAAGSAIPEALKSRGYARAAAVTGRAAAVASSPPGWIIGGTLAVSATLDYCECK